MRISPGRTPGFGVTYRQAELVSSTVASVADPFGKPRRKKKLFSFEVAAVGVYIKSTTVYIFDSPFLSASYYIYASIQSIFLIN